MSMTFRLNALIVALFTIGLGLSLLSMILSAGPRIHAENDSIMRLAEEFVETTIGSLQGTPNPGARLKVLLDGLKELRHVHIYRADDQAAAALQEEPFAEGVPGWLAQLGDPVAPREIPIEVNGEDFGTLVIAPRVSDEAEEIWDAVINFAGIGGIVAIAMVLLTSLLIRHLLQPIKQVGDALMVLDAGCYDVVVPETGPPEIADICRKLNRFAARLDGTISENRRLAQRIIAVQDEERKDLARELHDELGPYHFAVRAAAATLKSELQKGGEDKEKLLKTCDTLIERMEAIQRMNRAVLQKLRPMGLEDFGLKAKLSSLAALMRETSSVTINFAVDDGLPKFDETSNLTIYRLVQEGLTNAFRHSDATAVDVVVAPARAEETPAAIGDLSRPVVHVTVSDNGKGMPTHAKPSYGVAGMNERVWATGGEIRLSNRPGGGLTLEAWVPVTLAAPAGSRSRA